VAVAVAVGAGADSEAQALRAMAAASKMNRVVWSVVCFISYSSLDSISGVSSTSLPGSTCTVQ
jgi:hypothetical protein